MVWTKELFEETYLHKIVRPRGNYYDLPMEDYVVTAALYEFEGDGVSIFAIEHDGDHWFTIKIEKEEFEECMADFEIID